MDGRVGHSRGRRADHIERQLHDGYNGTERRRLRFACRPGFPKDAAAESEFLGGLPFLDIALVGPEDFSIFLSDVFAADRIGVTKGTIEVIP